MLGSWLWATPAPGRGGEPTVIETSSTSSETIVEDRTVDVDEHRTRVTASRGGVVVFDETVDAAPGSGAVQGLEARALAAVAGSGCATSGFGTTGSTRTLTDSRTMQQTTDSQEVTVEEYIGPAVVITGDRDSGGTPVTIQAGEIGININTHTTFVVTNTTTNTYLNEATRSATATCTGEPSPTPEPDPPAATAPSSAVAGAGAASALPVAGSPITAG